MYKQRIEIIISADEFVKKSHKKKPNPYFAKLMHNLNSGKKESQKCGWATSEIF
jgi:hypothetical protein